MPSAQITNPSGALQTVSDYRTNVDANSVPLVFGQTTDTFRANAAVAVGDALCFVTPTATVPLSVTPFPLDPTEVQMHLFAGVALNAAAAGKAVKVVRRGICLVNLTVTAANGANAGAGATAGTAVAGASVAAGNYLCAGGAGTSNVAGMLSNFVSSAATIEYGEVVGVALTIATSGKCLADIRPV